MRSVCSPCIISNNKSRSARGGRMTSCASSTPVRRRRFILGRGWWSGDRAALVRTDIDWRAFNCRQEWLKQKFADWDKWQDYNNADLIGEGWPPRDSNGDPYELHHIGQRQDSPFAELTWQEHMGGGNNVILHPNRESAIDRQQFDDEKSRYWQDRFKAFTKSELAEIYGR